MVFIDISKYEIFPNNLEKIKFYDILDYSKYNRPKIPFTLWERIIHLFKGAPLYVSRPEKIKNHPNLYWNGYYLKSNPAQIVIHYNPLNIHKYEVIDFMNNLGGYKIIDE